MRFQVFRSTKWGLSADFWVHRRKSVSVPIRLKLRYMNV
jgi:hypothetical protein